MKPTPSPDCMHCGQPHGRPLRWIFESCDACDAKRDREMVAASEGLVTASCPRCDLQFSVDARPTLTDMERECLKWAEEIAGNCEEFDRVEVLRGLLARLGGEHAV